MFTPLESVSMSLLNDSFCTERIITFLAFNSSLTVCACEQRCQPLHVLDSLVDLEEQATWMSDAMALCKDFQEENL